MLGATNRDLKTTTHMLLLPTTAYGFLFAVPQNIPWKGQLKFASRGIINFFTKNVFNSLIKFSMKQVALRNYTIIAHKKEIPQATHNCELDLNKMLLIGTPKRQNVCKSTTSLSIRIPFESYRSCTTSKQSISNRDSHDIRTYSMKITNGSQRIDETKSRHNQSIMCTTINLNNASAWPGRRRLKCQRVKDIFTTKKRIKLSKEFMKLKNWAS